jgi:hypothetical protein
VSSSNIRGDLETLHRPEGGTPDLHHGATAVTYAKHLARYVTCASTIRAYVRSNYGVTLPIDRIEGFRAKHQEVRERYSAASAQLEFVPQDALPFRVSTPKKEPAPYVPSVVRIGAPALAGEILAGIAREFGLTASDLIGKERTKVVCEARHTAAYVLVRRGNSLSWTGRKLERDHSSIMHSVRTFEASATAKMRAVAAGFLGEAA